MCAIISQAAGSPSKLFFVSLNEADIPRIQNSFEPMRFFHALLRIQEFSSIHALEQHLYEVFASLLVIRIYQL